MNGATVGRDALRTAALPALILAAGVALYFAPYCLLGMHAVPFGLLPPAVTGIDPAHLRVLPGASLPGGDSSAVLIHYPNAWFAGEALRSLSLPTWNPYVACGAPALENGQTFPFNPFLWSFYLHPSPWTYTLGLLLGSAFCAAGAFLLLGRFTSVSWQRAAGALLWTFNPWSVHLVVYSDVWAGWWFPWVLWAWGGVLEGTRPWWFPSPFLALMAMSGHVEASFLLATASAVWCAADWLGRERKRRPRLALFAARTLGTAGLAALLAAVQWLPVALRLREAAPYKLDDPWAVTVPFYLWSSLLRPGSEVYLSPLLFGLLCAGLPVLWSRRQARLPALFLVAAALWAFAAVPLAVVVRTLTLGGLLPGVYARCLIWAGVVPLALAALTRWEPEEVRLRWRTAAWFTMPYLALTALGWGVWRGSGQGAGLGLLFFEACGASLLILGLLARAASLRSAALALGLLCACLDPLAAQGFRWPYFNRADPLADGPPAISALESSDPEGMSRFSGLWMGPGSAALSPGLASVWNVKDVRVTDVLNSRRYVRLHEILEQGRGGRLGTWLGFPGVAPEALGLLGVRAFASPSSPADAAPSWIAVGGMPRAYLVHSILPATDEMDAVRQMAELVPRFTAGRLRQEAVVEGMGTTTALGAPDPGDAVAKVEDGLDRVALKTRSASAALLVLLDTYAEGWRAEVDGRPATIRPANLAFRAVDVPAGVHEVVFRYAPRSVQWGEGLTTLGLLLLLVAVLLARRGGRP